MRWGMVLKSSPFWLYKVIHEWQFIHVSIALYKLYTIMQYFIWCCFDRGWIRTTQSFCVCMASKTGQEKHRLQVESYTRDHVWIPFAYTSTYVLYTHTVDNTVVFQMHVLYFNTYIHLQTHICKHAYTHTHACTCIHMHTHAYTCKHMRTHANTCIHTCLHILYTYIYIYTHSYTYI